MRILCTLVASVLSTGPHLAAQAPWTFNQSTGHAYQLSPPMGWVQAEAFAATLGGHLVTIRSATEQAWLYQAFGTQGTWIGFTDLQAEGQWAWTTGEPVSYTNWCSGEPNNASNEDFANLSGCGGWNDVEDTISIPGIVERPPLPPTWVQNPANGRYYTLTEPLPWQAAETLAASFGGHLATVRSQSEHAWLVQTFGSYAQPDTRVWIGLTDAAVEGTWEWSSGEPFTYSNWGLFEPDNSGNQDHAALWLVPGGAWFWCDEHGSNPHCAVLEVNAPTPAASYTTYGAACAGPNGTAPTLTSVPGEVPRPGTTSHIRVANLPLAVTIPVFVIGFSDAWDPDGYPLPIDLGVVGWPGCPQLVSDEILYWQITLSGQADQPISIPAGYPLGFRFYVQALVLYTPTGTALSNAVAGVVGY